jgi:pSer/pThr/pTyr-binding forkhead associated (FHA) protein
VAVLVTFDTTPSGAAFPIRVGRNRIGRNPESEISVPNDQAMSGTNTYIHFYEGSGSFVISDEHSQNGTFVNGNNIEADSVKLSNYATIRAGVTQFTLMMVHPPVLANPLETEV